MKFNFLKPYPLVAAYVLFTLGTLTSILMIVNVFWLFGSALLVLNLVTFAYFAYNFLMSKIIITERGVKYIAPFRRYEKRWDEIENIGVLFFYARKESASIFFTTDTDLAQRLKTREGIKICDSYFSMGYRKKAENEIKKYWTDPIERWYGGILIENDSKLW